MTRDEMIDKAVRYSRFIYAGIPYEVVLDGSGARSICQPTGFFIERVRAEFRRIASEHG